MVQSHDRQAGERIGEDLGREFDLGMLWERIRRNWYWYVLSLIACVAAAWLYLRYTPPTYSSFAKVLIKNEDTGLGLGTEALGQELGFENAYNIVDEIQVIRSRPLLRDVVDSLGLGVGYTHLGRVVETDLYQPPGFRVSLTDSIVYDEAVAQVYGDAYFFVDAHRDVYHLADWREGVAEDTVRVGDGALVEIGNRWFTLRLDDYEIDDLPTGVLRVSTKDEEVLANYYANALSTEQVEKSNVILLNLAGESRERVADVLNALVYFYDLTIILDNGKSGELTVDFIAERLEDIRLELYDVEARMSGFKENQRLAVGVTGTAEDYLARINESDEALAELQVRQEIIGEILRVVQLEETKYESIPISSEIIDGVLAELIGRYNLLVFERENTLEVATGANPQVATYEEQIDNLRETLVRSLRSLRKESAEREQRIRERIAPLEEQLSSIPASERQLIQLEREKAIKQEVYIFLSERLEETAITVAAQRGNTRVIEPAVEARFPNWPKPAASYAFALFAALFFPTAVLAGLEVFDAKVRKKSQIAETTSVPLLGVVLAGAGAPGLDVRAGERTAQVETLRLLRTNLSFRLREQASAIALVTSSSSGEGKSYVTANLGAAAALAGMRVLVVESDFHKPALLKHLYRRVDRAIQHRGLVQVLAGELPLHEAVVDSPVENLSVLTNGQASVQSIETLLTADNLERLTGELKAHYDLVLIDTAPITLVTDALLYRNFVDVSLYVVRYGYTPLKSMSELEWLAQTDKLAHPVVVLNGMPPPRNNTYGGGYGYYSS